jgi:hypothetical protein
MYIAAVKFTNGIFCLVENIPAESSDEAYSLIKKKSFIKTVYWIERSE